MLMSKLKRTEFSIQAFVRINYLLSEIRRGLIVGNVNCNRCKQPALLIKPCAHHGDTSTFLHHVMSFFLTEHVSSSGSTQHPTDDNNHNTQEQLTVVPVVPVMHRLNLLRTSMRIALGNPVIQIRARPTDMPRVNRRARAHQAQAPIKETPNMPRPSKAQIESTISSVIEELESLPPAELALLINRMRDDQSERVLESFDKAWKAIENAADQHFALTGQALPAPTSIEDVFANSPIKGSRRIVARPDAWYAFEISSVIRFAGEDGASEEFINDFISARGGDGRRATRGILPKLQDAGYIQKDESGTWKLANSKPDAWYDFQVLGFINSRDANNLPTSTEIHDHIIEQGGHGADVFTNVLPRLQNAGRVVESADGVWDSTTRRPNAWYDYTISSFIESSDPASPPSTKDVHDHVIAQGGHGIEAVTDALPRLLHAGVINEVEEDRWDSARRRPDAWYDFQVMSFLDALADGETATSKQLHDHIIEQGGHGIEVFNKILPRLKAVGRVSEVEDSVWAPAHRQPRAWYDHLVMSTIRACDRNSLPTLKQLHDKAIQLGGHGVFIATDVLPDLITKGEVIEVEDGVYDVANRRCDVWYDQTVYGYIEQADGPVTSMQVYEYVMDQGGHGSQIFNEVFPRLVRAGLISEIETGTWVSSAGVPLAIIETQLVQAIRLNGGEPTPLKGCLAGIDEDLAQEDVVVPALERLVESGFIEKVMDDDNPSWRIPGAAKRKSASPAAKTRRRRLAA